MARSYRLVKLSETLMAMFRALTGRSFWLWEEEAEGQRIRAAVVELGIIERRCLPVVLGKPRARAALFVLYDLFPWRALIHYGWLDLCG
jgi:hypothetical protein